jgi:Fe2+ or Zn2+ uptake regulation protein
LIEHGIHLHDRLMPPEPARTAPRTAARNLPRNYALVLDVIRSPGLHHHRTAVEIFDETRARNPDVGFATVHRGLGRLVELGLIAKVELPGGAAALYESETGAHAHLRCRRCGAVRDVDAAVVPEARAELARRDADFIPDAAGATFLGVCRTCGGER